MFQYDQQLYDLIFCACTAQEEEQWKSTLMERTNAKKIDDDNWLKNISFEHSALYLEVRSLGPVFGQPGTLMRRQSIQRAATLNSRREACQVIIRNTSSVKTRGDPATNISESVGRSQSLLSMSKVPLLSPSRADRYRIEQTMASVWTRDLLPYPGMVGHRRGSLIASATMVMRKFSRASTTTTSTTNSTTSISCSNIAATSTRAAHTAASRALQSYEMSPCYPGQCQPVMSAQEVGGCDTGPDRDNSAASPTNTRANGTELSTISNGSMALSDSEVSGVSTALPGRISPEVEQGRGKPRNPKILLKAFSTEGIRGWFH